jgi:glutamate dehydrogenase (NAD(P)+)
MAGLLLKTGSRLIRPTVAEVPRVLSTSGFHTSSTAAGTWAIPERLQNIPEAEDPNFFNMVEYYFHKACILAEDNLVSACGLNCY